jgi:hypothetical protein
MKRKLLISRRDFWGMSAGLTSAGWLRAQEAQRPDFPVQAKMVVLKVAVLDRTGYINGLKASDFRVLEDGILQKISIFARPLLDGKPTVEPGKPEPDPETFESIREDLDNSYTISYYPNPSNHNEGFRRIKIEIIPDVARRWKVRHRPGYRPDRRTGEEERR